MQPSVVSIAPWCSQEKHKHRNNKELASHVHGTTEVTYWLAPVERQRSRCCTSIREVPSLTWRPVLHLSGSRWWGGQQLQLVASPRANLQIAQTGGPSPGHPTPKERRVHWGQRRCGKAVLLGNHWPGG